MVLVVVLVMLTVLAVLALLTMALAALTALAVLMDVATTVPSRRSGERNRTVKPLFIRGVRIVYNI